MGKNTDLAVEELLTSVLDEAYRIERNPHKRAKIYTKLGVELIKFARDMEYEFEEAR